MTPPTAKQDMKTQDNETRSEENRKCNRKAAHDKDKALKRSKIRLSLTHDRYDEGSRESSSRLTVQLTDTKNALPLPGNPTKEGHCASVLVRRKKLNARIGALHSTEVAWMYIPLTAVAVLNADPFG
jgi:hypothetical protein